MSRTEQKDLVISRLASNDQAEQCARMMAGSEPWITLGRDHESCLNLLGAPSREVYVGLIGEQVAGFIILVMQGVFRGYIQTVGVLPSLRSRGFGTQLIEFAEQRIFREVPNVFLCVSSFNVQAQRLYRRLGYEVIGEIREFFVPGHSEILMRKSLGPWIEFKRPR
ncbi:GNAT family N-acetyltransferase [Candidatus Zixiibacteriota bacterium]